MSLSLPYLQPGSPHTLRAPALASGSPLPPLCQYNLCSVQSATLHNKLSLPVLLCLCAWSWGRCLATAFIFQAAGDYISLRSPPEGSCPITEPSSAILAVCVCV